MKLGKSLLLRSLPTWFPLIIGLFLSQCESSATVLAGWDVHSASGYGAPILSASTSAANLTVGGLTKGSGIGLTGTAAARGWGGNNWISTSASNAVTANQFATFTATANAGYAVSFTSVSQFNYRRSSTGASLGVLQYQLGTGAFTVITALAYSSSLSTGTNLAPIDLSGVAALQNVGAGTNVTFRIVNYGGTGATGTWYIFDVANSTANDLEFQGTVVLAITNGAIFTGLTNIISVTPGAGITNVTVAGKLNAPGPVYPAAGETISVTVNGAALTATVTDSTGDFSTSFDPATIPYSTNLYPITISYAGTPAIAAGTTNLPSLVASTYYASDALPGFISGMNLFFTNQPGLSMFAWSSANPALPVASWTPEGPLAELGVNDGTGRSRYSINVNPSASLVYYILGPTNIWPYVTPTAIQWLTTADFVDYAFSMTNTTISAQGILGLPAAPVIVQQPAAQTTVLLGQTAVISAAITGSTPLSYQWFFNTNTPLAGMTNSSLTLTNVSTNLAGNYNVVATNQYGGVTSSFGNLSVLPAPKLSGTAIAGGFQWSGITISNETYWVQTATSLTPPIVWSTLVTNRANTNGSFSFSDTNLLNNSSRFYRIVFR